MSIRRSFSLLLLLVVALQGAGPSSAQPAEPAPSQELPGVRVAYVGPSYRTASTSTLSFEYAYLKQSIGLWADGKGDMLLEQHITNTSSDPSEVLDRFTCRFSGWASDGYSNISAKDSRGPLVIEQSMQDDGLYVTVIFRRPIQPQTTYEFKLLITIASLAQGSGDNWTASWYTSGGGSVKIFEEVLALPANSSITSISPPATERHGNIITWRLENQSDWTLSINVPYVLSNHISVPLFLQAALPWGPEPYAYNTPAYTMADWGCLTTSGAMIVNYLAVSQTRSHRTDPGVLNSWLRDNSGYTATNGVKHAWVGKYARVSPHDISMYWNRSVPYNSTTVDYYLRSGYPVILGVDPIEVDGQTFPGHYVVATGKATDGETSTYSINDPAYGSTTLLKQWSNVALTMILFSASEANQQLLYFAAQSPIEFVVQDPIGRRSGYDPTTDTTWSEIPDAYYMYDGLGDVDGNSDPVSMKTLNIPDPLDGEYLVTVYGTGIGDYILEATSMDWQGISANYLFTGSTSEGESHTYAVTYSQVMNLLYIPLVVQ